MTTFVALTARHGDEPHKISVLGVHSYDTDEVGYKAMLTDFEERCVKTINKGAADSDDMDETMHYVMIDWLFIFEADSPAYTIRRSKPLRRVKMGDKNLPPPDYFECVFDSRMVMQTEELTVRFEEQEGRREGDDA